MSPFLPMIRGFLLRELRSLRLELEAYPDERSVWALPPGAPNSGGTLVLHLTGNLQHYVGAVLGGSGYIRDRKKEFAARDLPRASLLEQISAAETAIEQTLPSLREDLLTLPYPEPLRDHHVETGEFLMQLAVHLGYHLGQLSYHRRLVTGDATGVGALSAGELSTARPL
jgi:hypothetical protein